MNKEEIERAKEDLMFFNEGDYITREMDKSADILEKYIQELEEIKEIKEAIELAGMDIKSLLNFKYENKRLKNKIDQLEFQIQAKEKENKYDVNMIDEVKGEAVKLYKEIDKQNKIIDEMAEEINAETLDKIDWCKLYNKGICGYDDTCLKCLKQYFERKVEEDNG